MVDKAEDKAAGPEFRRLDTDSLIGLLRQASPQRAAQLLAGLPPARAARILEALPADIRAPIMAAAPAGTDWADAQRYPEGSVGRLLEDPPAVFPLGTRVGDAIDRLRSVVKARMVTYLFVVDAAQRLQGVVAFRELLYADRAQALDDVMLRNPFALSPSAPLIKAMHDVVQRHYPVYPICEADGTLVGQVRGQALFEQQAFEISAQAGAMVGVEKEERLATPWTRSFRFRHPWLLLNLLTVFVAAGVVGVFQDTINEIVVLAMFLPVLAGQSGNLGAQSLAVVVRSMTLGELRGASIPRLLGKEAWLGFLNGLGTGALAAAAMAVIARERADMPVLAVTVLIAMTVSCAFSGIAGAGVPLALKRLGADPATASAIILSTLTDVASMGLFLGLASVLLALHG
ncbi:MAG: magnesium transporter [Silanimonas sp.]